MCCIGKAAEKSLNKLKIDNHPNYVSLRLSVVGTYDIILGQVLYRHNSGRFHFNSYGTIQPTHLFILRTGLIDSLRLPRSVELVLKINI